MAKKKYIIELEEGKQFLVLSDTGMISVGSPEALFEEKNEDMLRPLGIIRAQPYTEPDTEQVRKEAYEKGVQDTKQHWVDFPRTCEYKLGYENGLNDVWEAAKKIYKMPHEERMRCFGAIRPFSDQTPQEAIEKIQQYEQEKEEIKVGDVVEAPFGAAIVTYAEGNRVEFFHDSGAYGWDKKENITKTGKFFPEIAEVLRKMREQ